jgi:hypothetical protein
MARWWARAAVALTLTLGLSAYASAATDPYPTTSRVKRFQFLVPPSARCGPITFVLVNETDSDHNFSIIGAGDAGVGPTVPAGGPPASFTVTLAPGPWRYQSDVGSDSKLGLAGGIHIYQ